MALRKQDTSKLQVKALVDVADVSGLLDLLLEEETKGSASSQALDGLIAINTQAAWEALGSVISVIETAVVELILDKLGESRVPGAVRALGQALSNPNVFVRSQAVRSLARNWGPPVMPHLLRASRDPAPPVARTALRVLRERVHRHPDILTEIRPNTAEGVIEFMSLDWAMEFLSDAFPEHIRIMAARRVGQIGGEEATQCLASCVQSFTGSLAETCWQALESCQDVHEFILLPLLVDPNSAVKARAVRIYARFAKEQAADLLEGLTRDSDPCVRREALTGLVRVRDVGSISNLVAALKDRDESVGICAVGLLATIADSSPELVDASTFFKGEIRRVALMTLANRGIVVPSLMPHYFEFLLRGSTLTDTSDKDYLDAINSICKALASEQNPEALIAFTGLARSIIRRLRRTAIASIMSYDPQDRKDALHCLIDSEDKDIVRNVAMGLHEIRDNRCIHALIRVAHDLRGKPAMLAKAGLETYPEVETIRFLLEGLKSRWAAVRMYAAEALKIKKDPAATPGLLEASHDEDVEVQLAVVEALGPLAGENQIVVTRMLEVVRQSDVSVRQAACEALGEARCQEAVPELIRALHNYFLRPRAEQALKMIGDRKGYLAIKRLERREKLFPKKPRDVILAKKKAAI